MISSFRLPDLVLGVAIKADTSGSRQAAQELKSSLQKEMGSIGGRGGGMGSALLSGAVAGSVVSSTANKVAATIAKTVEEIRKDIWKKIIAEAKPSAKGPLRGGQAFSEVFARDWKGPGNWRFGDWRNSLGAVQWRARQAQLSAELNPFGRKPATDISRMVASSAAGATATAAAAAGGAAAAAAAAKKSGGILASLRSFRSIWHLIIGVLIVGTIMQVVKTLLPALDYIRKVRPQGKFGVFGEQADIMQATARNVSVQWGLMIIQLLELDKVLAAFNDRLIQLGSLFGWLGENKGIAFLVKTLLSANPNIQMLKFLNWAASKLPQGNGGIDLGAGGPSARLGGAALEGSVEAYRIIQGTLARYAAETAKNTKEAAGALKQILNRAPAMGVVPG